MNLCTSTHVHGKQVQKTVKRIGYIDEFTDKYPDPLAHFKEEAKRLTEEEKASKVTLEYSLSEHFDFSTDFNKQEWTDMYEGFAKSEVKVWECRNCGHIVVGTKAPEVCPVCAHPQAYFEVNAENY